MKRKAIRWTLLPLLAAGALAGQAATRADEAYTDLEIIAAQAELRPGGSLLVRMTARGGGCATYDRLLVTRGLDRLDLRAQMLRSKPRGSTPQPCTADLRPFPIRYEDPLYPSQSHRLPGSPGSPGPEQAERTIQVHVNGKLAGTVKLK